MDPGAPFEIQIDADGVTWLRGELDLSNADSLLERVSSRLDATVPVVDASGLTFLDSSGIRAIVQMAQDCGRTLIFRNPPENVRKVLEIAGVNETMGVRIESDQ